MAPGGTDPPPYTTECIGSVDGSGAHESDAEQLDAQHQPGQPIPLSDPLDALHLSSLFGQVRAQLEIFPASDEDVVARNRKGGSKHPLTFGRAGIRCKWCAHLPHNERGNGAVSYPNSLSLVYQAVRNWQRHHLKKCPEIPQSVKDEMEIIGRNRTHSGTKSLAYWVDSCERKGMYETGKESDGIRLKGVDYSSVDNRESGSVNDSNEATRKTAQKKQAKAPKQARKPQAKNKAEVEAKAVRKIEAETFAKAEDQYVAPSSQHLACGIKESDEVSEEEGENDFGPAAAARLESEQFSQRASSALSSASADTDELLDGLAVSPLDVFEAHEGEALAGILSESVVASSAPAADAIDSHLDVFEAHEGEALAGILSESVVDSSEPAADAIEAHVELVRNSSPSNSLAALIDTFDMGELDSGSPAQDSKITGIPEAQWEPIPVLPESSSFCPQNGRVSNAASKSEQTEKLIQKVHLAYNMVEAACTIQHMPGTGEGHGSGSADSAQGNHQQTLGQNVSQMDPDVQNELFSLGVELYELFAENHPFAKDHDDGDGNGSDREGNGGIKSNSNSTVASTLAVSPSEGCDQHPQKKREKKSTDGNYTPLRELGFPVLLCNLVSSLLGEYGGGGTTSSAIRLYQSMDQVKEDLRLMTVDHDRYLFDPVMSGRAFSLGGTMPLEFPRGTLYGRSKQSRSLMDAYNRVIRSGGACEMLLVSGYSGTGKSALVQQVRGPLREKGGYFIAGKFDEMRQAMPLSAIVAALNEYCDTLMESDAVSLSQIRTDIKNAVGSDGKVLTDLIPNLCNIIGEPDPDQAVVVEGTMALNRLMFFFRKFLQAISSTAHPIVFFLDDLQWADEASLDLITSLITDAETKHFLFLGCYRDNEVSEGHLLMAQLATIQRSGVRVTTISVDNLESGAVNELISDALRLSPHQTQLLADLVHSKTSGNALFVVQFLQSLHEDGLLCFSLSSQRWEWDMEAILSKKVADNVVDFMTSKMLRLPANVLWGLMLAACLGCQCDEDIISLLDIDGAGESDAGPSSTMAGRLDIAVREGMMFKIGATYKFSHDQIQHAAYSLIQTTSTGQAALHLQIGRTLAKKSSSANIDNLLFVLVDQLRRGENLIDDREEKNDLANLYLLAGKKAMSSSAFLPASIYLLQGIALLDESHWSSHYDLALETFNRCAESQYVTGNLDRVSPIAHMVIKHGRSLLDKIPAYYILAKTLASQKKRLDGIKCCLDVLSELGECFPDEPCKEDVQKEFIKTRRMLEETTVDRIAMHTAEMHDADAVATMRFLSILTLYTYQSHQDLMALAIFRMVKISLSSGLDKESSHAFATFGLMLCKIGEYGLGRQYGKLALTLLERAKAKDCVARVYCTVYSLVNTFTEPVQACLPPLKYGYDAGMTTGDVEWALWSANRYVATGFFCGHKLELLINETRAYLKEMKEYKSEVISVSTAVYLQGSLNLIGSSDDATLLTGEAMNQADLMTYVLESKLMAVEGTIYLMRMMLAYLFGKYELAAEMAERRRILNKERPVRNVVLVPETFYMGLIAAAIARTESDSEESSWRHMAYDAREKLQTWVKHSSWNFQHKLELLNAEIAYLNEDVDNAAKTYDKAIRVAGEHKFVHEQALACERAGIFHMEKASALIAKEYFVRARQYYLEWGATRKADELLGRLI